MAKKITQLEEFVAPTSIDEVEEILGEVISEEVAQQVEEKVQELKNNGEVKTVSDELKDKARNLIKENIIKIEDSHIDKQAILPILESVLSLF